MAPPPISPLVRRFLEECIDSVPQLEALLIMVDDPSRGWTADDIAARVYVSAAEATRILDRLSRRELIHADGSGTHFRFAADDVRKRALIAEVAATYRANLTLIATFIHEKAPASLKEFARAFDLKRDR
jgi:hypothetical protein